MTLEAVFFYLYFHFYSFIFLANGGNNLPFHHLFISSKRTFHHSNTSNWIHNRLQESFHQPLTTLHVPCFANARYIYVESHKFSKAVIPPECMNSFQLWYCSMIRSHHMHICRISGSRYYDIVYGKLIAIIELESEILKWFPSTYIHRIMTVIDSVGVFTYGLGICSNLFRVAYGIHCESSYTVCAQCICILHSKNGCVPSGWENSIVQYCLL